jgi:hypothetical protein
MDVAQFHTSAAALASELTMRKMASESGYSDAEIDEMLLVGYLQQFFFRRWAIVMSSGVSVL